MSYGLRVTGYGLSVKGQRLRVKRYGLMARIKGGGVWCLVLMLRS